jgi:hypothetical protein
MNISLHFLILDKPIQNAVVQEQFEKGVKRLYIVFRPETTTGRSSITPSTTGIPAIKKKQLEMKGVCPSLLTVPKLPDIRP